VPSVVSEVAVSSHRHLHNGKRASGSSQGRDEGNLFEAMLDTNGPDSAPKNEPKADTSSKPERPLPSRHASDADCEPRDPAASAESGTEATASVEGTETQAGVETDVLIETANAAIDTSQTVTTDEAAAALAVTVEPVVPQPVAAAVVAVAIATAAAPVATDATANADIASVAPVGGTALPETIEAAPQTAPADAATPEALPAEAKPQIARAAGEKPGEEKPADGKVKAKPTTEDGTIAPKPVHADAGEKKAAPAADGPAKPDTPAAKPKVELETPRADNLASQRDNTAIPNADKADIVTLATVQAQAVHATGPASTAGRSEQTAVAIPVAGLAVEIAAQSRAGKNRFEIRLDPPELGRIDVRLDMDKDGNVTSRMTVERADTLDLLRRDAQQLERALNQAGLKTADNALEFQLRDQGFANNDNKRENGRDGAQVIIPDDDAAVLDAKRGYGRLLGLGNGLDISV
jgi:flagellar hook-length control protein FliK